MSRLGIRSRLQIGIGLFVLAIVVLTAFAAGSMNGDARLHMISLGCVLMLAGMTLGWWLMRGIVAPLAEIQALAHRLATGDLSESYQAHAGGELGELQSALQELGERLFRLVANVRLGTMSIATTSGIISNDNAALSSRTEAQASALEETSSTMEQLTSSVKQNAEHARHVNSLVAVASEHAARGGRAVGDVVDTMALIRESSRRIVDIIAVIDGIAFQTNILALNASVEAARAGCQGRGFAVVASAVRELAQRSAEAAKEIKALITESVEKVETGSQRVGEAGATMNELVASVNRVATLMSEIAEACAEQSVGIEEINRAVTHIDGVTQKNALLVEQAVKTASGLQEQAVDLTAAASVFSLGTREFGNADDAVALVKKGVAFVRAKGRNALIEDVLKLRKGRFIDRDLYFSINDVHGTCVANGANPRFVGADGNATMDSDGKYFVREILAIAKRQGSGWVDYKYPHPVTKKIQLKTTYFEKVDDIIISCGFYKMSGHVS